MCSDRFSSTAIVAGAVLIACSLLAGCSASADRLALAHEGAAFGEANRQTMAAQVIDPTPAYETPTLQSSAEHAGQAAERYRTDKVKKPDKTMTTQKLSASSGN